MADSVISHQEPPSAAVMSEIAKICDVPEKKIQDVYRCTPLQVSMIAERRAESFHFIVLFGSVSDIDRFSDALRDAVEVNSILRTRIVECAAGLVQVVVDEQHITTRQDGELNALMREERAALTLGKPLFRTMFVDRRFVATIHHAVMDYWSLTTLLEIDVTSVYFNLALPAIRPPFKAFVEHLDSIDSDMAKKFWQGRFTGLPVVFPTVTPSVRPDIVTGERRRVEVESSILGRLAAQMPFFAEAAWAATCSIYSNNEVVAYGYVLSGRSVPLHDGLEKTLGPTIVEVPVQANVKWTTTIEWLVKDRATSIRQVQGHSALQYGIENIAKVGPAAARAAGFTTLFNVRPALRPTLPNSAPKHNVSFEDMKWLGGLYPLQLICSIMEDCIFIEPRYDSKTISSEWLDQVLEQFSHMLQVITSSSMDMRLNDLPLLTTTDRAKLFRWNEGALRPAKQYHPSNGSETQEGWRKGMKSESSYKSHLTGYRDCYIWIVRSRNSCDLQPIGAVGEILLECNSDIGDDLVEHFETGALVDPAPQWSPRSDTTFYSTGDLAKYNFDGDAIFVGQQSNRVKIRDQVIQFEEIESILLGSEDVSDVCIFSKINAGRIQIVAVLCIPETAKATHGVLQDLPSEYASVKEDRLVKIQAFAGSQLDSTWTPSVWHLVQQLPRAVAGQIDRKSVREWVKSGGKTT